MSQPHRSSSENQRLERERRQAETLAQLDKIVDNSSEKNRNFFIAYLGLLIYVQAIVFSTTDLQLLVSSDGLRLPVIDLTVPLVGFYVVVPIFVIALHFNFLQNLESHHFKLMRWRDAHPDGIVPRVSIFPFLFDYAVLERSGQLLHWVRVANSVLCYELGPITLGLLLIRFSDRQDFLVTFWHFLTFVFDCYLVWKLRLAMQENEQAVPPPLDTASWLRRCGRFYAFGFRRGLRGAIGQLVLLELVLAGLIGASSDEFFVRHVQPWVQPVARVGSYETKLQIANRTKDFESWTEPAQKIVSRPVEWLLPHLVINPNDTVWKPDAKELQEAAKFAGKDDWVKYFKEHGTGFRPEPESLRLADLSSQNLPRAQFNGLPLQAALLSGAQLQGAELSGAQLQGAELSGAQLQGAKLTGAELQGTDLTGAQLQGTDLTEGQLQGADLLGAQLQGAKLIKAQLQGADLGFAQLQGADLSGSQLQGVEILFEDFLRDLEPSGKLQGIILNKTSIQWAFDITEASVFAFDHEPLFDEAEPDWKHMIERAETIPNAKRKKAYLERIQQAEKAGKNPIAKQNLVYASKEIAQAALTNVCKKGVFIYSRESQLEASQAFRNRYIGLQKEHSALSQNPDYLELLKDIDLKLCTLPECADLRAEIEGLDCSKVMPKPEATKTKP